MRYEVQDRFIWRFESPDDTVGKLLCFVFDPDDAADLAGMMNTAVSLANMVIQDCQPIRKPWHVSSEQIAQLRGQVPDELFTWDGEPGMRRTGYPEGHFGD